MTLSPFRYYGIDWLLAVLIITHLWMLGNKTRWAFVVGATASCLGVSFGYMVGSIASMIMNVIFFSMHVRAFVKWSKKSGLKGPQIAEGTWPDDSPCDFEHESLRS